MAMKNSRRCGSEVLIECPYHGPECVRCFFRDDLPGHKRTPKAESH